MKPVSKFQVVTDINLLKKQKSEMKQIMRAKTTPVLTRMQFARMIKLIDDIIDNSEPLSKYNRKLTKEITSKQRKKLKFGSRIKV